MTSTDPETRIVASTARTEEITDRGRIASRAAALPIDRHSVFAGPMPDVERVAALVRTAAA